MIFDVGTNLFTESSVYVLSELFDVKYGSAQQIKTVIEGKLTLY
jgi:hypothetical protein